MDSSAKTDGAMFPRQFGYYMLLSVIGSGGMGTVYLARRHMGGVEKHCVVKTLKMSNTTDGDYVARFIEEARIVVQLSHRNICSVFDVGKVGDRHYLAMEHVHGHDLKELLVRLAGRSQRLSAGMAAHLAIEVLDALDYAHRHEDPNTGKALRLVHRDVSPQNVMINYEGEVKLIDFGLAESLRKGEAASSPPATVMGKLAYMSPEHARGHPVDHRSDLFAAGILAYELFTGKRFYGDRSATEIWTLAGSGRHCPDEWARLDAGLREVLARALAAEAEQRYASCGAMRDALEEYRYARGMRAASAALRSMMTKVFAEERERSRRVLASFAHGAPTLSQTPTEPTVTIAVSRSTPARTPEHAQHMKPWHLALAVGGLLAGAALILAVVTAMAMRVRQARPSPTALAAAVAIGSPAIVARSDVVDAGIAVEVGGGAPNRPRPQPKRPLRSVAPGIDATDKEKIGYLTARCPRIACVKQVRKLDEQWRMTKSKGDIQLFKAELRSCVQTCAH